MTNSTVVYSCVMGSRLFGLANGGSDFDTMSVVVRPLNYYLGFQNEPATLHAVEPSDGGPKMDVTVHDARKYVGMLSTGNPNVLPSLWAPAEMVLVSTPASEYLRWRRNAFSTKAAARAFAGMASNEAKDEGWKKAARALMLLWQAVELLNTGELSPVVENVETLRALRAGQLEASEYSAMLVEANKTYRAALAASTLPDFLEPERSESLLVTFVRLALGLS